MYKTKGSLREGADAGGLPRATEGERVTIKLAQTQSYAGSFRHGYAVPPHPLADGISEGGFYATTIITQIGRESKFPADILYPLFLR